MQQYGLVLSLFVVTATWAQAPVSDTDTLEEILVTGEQPGPGLWKVSKDDHVLWILGMHGPLPKNMTWRSREVESIIAKSQRVVRWVNIETDLDVGFFAKLAALPSLLTAGNNPDDVNLKDIVPAEAYAHWQVLKAKYAGSDNHIEKLRPAFAALELRSKAIRAVGLSSEPETMIWSTVQRFARKHRVKTVEPEVRMNIKVDKPRAAIKQFRAAQLADVECFTQSLAQLNGDLDAMKTRANAWATGNLEVLRKIPPPDRSTDCAQMLQHAILSGQLADQMGAREMVDQVRSELARIFMQQNDTWVRTVEDALRNRETVFAIVPISNLFYAHGPLQTLRERGYQVDEP